MWRIFLNGYAKNGFIIFDGELITKEELLERLKDLKPEVVGEEGLTLGELIESSASWNNVLGQIT